jgi:uncharacterized protein (UPF0548 family)
VTVPLSYTEVGATRGAMPPGYRHLEVQQVSGHGDAWFRTVSDRLLSWEVHRRSGLQVSSRRVALGGDCELSLPVGPWWVHAPVRVVEIVDEATVQGFAYGTLPGHPEIGEERFLVHLDPDGTVRAEIRAFSRPGRWYARLGAPVARRYQRVVTRRYLNAMTYQPQLDDRSPDD